MENLKIEQWPVERLKPSITQLRQNDAVVPRMVEALRAFGFRVPLLATSAGEVIDGDLRLKAALALGMVTVPVIVADDLTPTQVRTFRLLVNRSATWADWAEDALRVELASLQALEVDLALTGFDSRELDAFILGVELPGQADPDAVPDPPAEPTSQPGDLWLLGRHRLLCGDSRSAAHVARLMDGEAADMIWTDPPYNVDYTGKAGKIKNDKMTPAEFDALLDGIFASCWQALADGGAIYVAHSEAGGGLAFRQAFARARFKLASCLVWRKHQLVIGRADYHWQHEPILYGWKPTGAHTWHGDRKQTTMLEHFAGAAVLESAPGEWQIATGDTVLLITGQGLTVRELATSIIAVPKPAKSDLHPTMKPVALVERMLANSSPRGGLVFDPCGGSGTTLMAAERMGRRCNTMELDPRFADVIVQRWEDYTGQTATLAAGPGTPAAVLQEAAHA